MKAKGSSAVFRSSADRKVTVESGFSRMTRSCSSLCWHSLRRRRAARSVLRGPAELLQNARRRLWRRGTAALRHLEAMSTALAKWDEEIGDWERQVRPRLNGADPQSCAAGPHVPGLALTWNGALRGRPARIRRRHQIDPRRAAFPRFKGLIHQVGAAWAPRRMRFWAAWLLDPVDPQNAYRPIAFQIRSDDRRRTRARSTLVERGARDS